MKRWWVLGAVLLAMALATGAAAQQNVLVLYGSPDRDWVAAIANKFEKDTGTKVPWIRASSNEMYAKIEAEKANPQGDVWFGGTGDPHFAAAEVVGGGGDVDEQLHETVEVQLRVAGSYNSALANPR